MELLQKQGLLVSQGSGKPRRIELAASGKAPGIRIGILLYEPADRDVPHMQRLRRRLSAADHACFFAEKTLTELQMKATRVANYVKKCDADAWLVAAGPKDVLEWFAGQPLPAFALFGRSVEVDMAATGPTKEPALRTAVRELVELGHQRVVMLARRERRLPSPGFLERMFLDELGSHGIATGSYNLPDCEERPGGLQQMLDALFRHTPPTALLIQASDLTVATLAYAASRDLRIPQDFSIISMDPSPNYAFCEPAIAHLAFDSEPWLRRIEQWARNVSRGKDDRRRVFYPAEFIKGGTIGQAKES